MGQVPVGPSGSPPLDSWAAQFNQHPSNGGFLGRHSPNVPHSHLIPMEPISQMHGIPNGMRLINTDINENSQGYSDFSVTGNPNHVEVY